LSLAVAARRREYERYSVFESTRRSATAGGPFVVILPNSSYLDFAIGLPSRLSREQMKHKYSGISFAGFSFAGIGSAGTRFAGIWFAGIRFAGIWGRAREFFRSTRSGYAGRRPPQGKSLIYQQLEPRVVLSAAGLVDVGTQPVGELSGKIVYTHGGHGITGDFPNTGDWSFQRPLLLNMIEDLGNQDQMTFFADYLFRAGATVVPLRPVGHQSNEVVLDNDDVEVTFSGPWSDAVDNVYFGDVGDVPYRQASTSVTETAFARYRPNIAEAGFYPVYAWTSHGADRAIDQLYRVNHSGGITEITVNHRRVGNGTVYLGNYYFNAGTDGFVDVSNRSNDAGRIVVADMIRFGNGVGDVQKSGTISGRDREDEAGLYWVEWHVDRSQGIPESEYRSTTNDRNATVSLSPRYAEFMNREVDGSLSDRVFVSFHSNAGGDAELSDSTMNRMVAIPPIKSCWRPCWDRR